MIWLLLSAVTALHKKIITSTQPSTPFYLFHRSHADGVGAVAAIFPHSPPFACFRFTRELRVCLPYVFWLRTVETSGVCLHGRDVDVALCINLVCVVIQQTRCELRVRDGNARAVFLGYSEQERGGGRRRLLFCDCWCCFVCAASASVRHYQLR